MKKKKTLENVSSTEEKRSRRFCYEFLIGKQEKQNTNSTRRVNVTVSVDRFGDGRFFLISLSVRRRRREGVRKALFTARRVYL